MSTATSIYSKREMYTKHRGHGQNFPPKNSTLKKLFFEILLRYALNTVFHKSQFQRLKIKAFFTEQWTKLSGHFQKLGFCGPKKLKNDPEMALFQHKRSRIK